MSLKHVSGRVIVSIDLDGKDSHKFEDGTVIYRGRRFNNLNRRETEPVNAHVISGENIPEGVEILAHPNAFCEANKIHNYLALSGNETASSVKYFSIEEEQCFIWYDKKSATWNPLKGFATALRVFKPYSGNIAGIKPLQIRDVLYITSEGDLKGKVVNTLKACDYELIFMDSTTGREGRIIRLRHYDYRHDREEIIAINHNLTEKVESGELLVGLSISDCKNINIEYATELFSSS